jgi:hypothetical protein
VRGPVTELALTLVPNRVLVLPFAFLFATTALFGVLARELFLRRFRDGGRLGPEQRRVVGDLPEP